MQNLRSSSARLTQNLYFNKIGNISVIEFQKHWPRQQDSSLLLRASHRNQRWNCQLGTVPLSAHFFLWLKKDGWWRMETGSFHFSITQHHLYLQLSAGGKEKNEKMAESSPSMISAYVRRRYIKRGFPLYSRGLFHKVKIIRFRELAKILPWLLMSGTWGKRNQRLASHGHHTWAVSCHMQFCARPCCSAAQSCPTLCDRTDCSTPGLDLP